MKRACWTDCCCLVGVKKVEEVDGRKRKEEGSEEIYTLVSSDES